MPVKPRPKSHARKVTEVKAKPTTTRAKKTTTKAAAAKPATNRTSARNTTATKNTKTKATPAKKAAAPRSAPSPRELDLHGFVPGSDSALIAQAFIDGGDTRSDVNHRAAALVKSANGLKTRNGTEKNIPSLGAGVLKALSERGYTIESSYRVVPPADVQAEMKKQAAAAKRRAGRAVKK
jgi:hypothetical protein